MINDIMDKPPLLQLDSSNRETQAAKLNPPLSGTSQAGTRLRVPLRHWLGLVSRRRNQTLHLRPHTSHHCITILRSFIVVYFTIATSIVTFSLSPISSSASFHWWKGSFGGTKMVACILKRGVPLIGAGAVDVSISSMLMPCPAR